MIDAVVAADHFTCWTCWTSVMCCSSDCLFFQSTYLQSDVQVCSLQMAFLSHCAVSMWGQFWLWEGQLLWKERSESRKWISCIISVCLYHRKKCLGLTRKATFIFFFYFQSVHSTSSKDNFEVKNCRFSMSSGLYLANATADRNIGFLKTSLSVSYVMKPRFSVTSQQVC